MHNHQYYQLITHPDFSETQTTEVRRHAVWEKGRLKEFDDMEVVVTELVSGGEQQNASFKGYYTASGVNIGRPVAVFKKGVTGALAKKTQGFRVSTIDDRLKHGKYKVFDVMFAAEPLVPESGLIIRAAD
jgi:hypothetical protein